MRIGAHRHPSVSSATSGGVGTLIDYDGSQYCHLERHAKYTGDRHWVVAGERWIRRLRCVKGTLSTKSYRL